MNPPSPDSLSLKDVSHSADYKASLRHATIRQILNAAHIESHFEIDGQEVGFVLVIANVYDVSYQGRKLEFGLDDGTGRIKASLRNVEGEDAQQELAEHDLQNFTYVRIIGKISEFRGIYSIDLTKKHFVLDPHEIYHHLLSVMAESIVLRRGLPNPALVQSLTIQGMTATQSPEALSLHPLQRDLPDINAKEMPMQPRGTTQLRSASSSDTSQSLDQNLENLPQPRTPPSTPPTPPMPEETPYRVNHPVESAISPIFVSPPPRSYLPRLQVLPPERLIKASTTLSTVSTATVTKYRASPEFVSPKTSPPRPDVLYHEFEPPQLGETATASPENTKSLPKPSRTQRPVSRRRDPYSHLSTLQRDIILTIQNAQNTLTTAGDTWRGVSVTVLVQTIARRRHGLAGSELEDALNFLLEEGYIHTTIDDCHFGCT